MNIERTNHSSLKTNFPRQVGFGKSGKLWSRTEAIRACRIERKKKEDRINTGIKNDTLLNKRITNNFFTIAKRTKIGFRLSGVGEVKCKNFKDLKTLLKTLTNPDGRKYTHIKVGCINHLIN